MPSIIFKKPPVVEVGISLQFLNNLEVADNRSKFHQLIKAEFPLVVIPEQNKHAYDFGDYALYTQNVADRLEIGLNYFRMVTTSYPGFAKFRTMFLSAFSMFCHTYGLDTFSDFFYYYNNQLPVSEGQLFHQCFALKVEVPDAFQQKFLSGQGVLIFQESEGYLAVDFKPEFNENQISNYGFNIRFGANRIISFKPERDEVTALLDIGHTHLEGYFLSLLQPAFLEFLQNR
jgi:uncharacterized protein (TIGR04255 family)